MPIEAPENGLNRILMGDSFNKFGRFSSSDAEPGVFYRWDLISQLVHPRALRRHKYHPYISRVNRAQNGYRTDDRRVMLFIAGFIGQSPFWNKPLFRLVYSRRYVGGGEQR